MKRAKKMFDLKNQYSLQSSHCWRETVLEEMILQAKLPILVHEIIFIELWKKNFLPKISAEFQSHIKVDEMQKHPAVQHSIVPLLQYEGECLKILDIAFFHPESIKSLGEATLDLTDYTLRCIKAALEQFQEPVEAWEANSHLMKISKSIPVRMLVDCLGILISLVLYDLDLKKCRPLKDAFVSRLILSTDSPMLISDLILYQPWEKDKRRNIPFFHFDSNCWHGVHPANKDNMDITSVGLLRFIFELEKVQSSYFRSNARKEKLRKVIEYLETKDQWVSEQACHSFKIVNGKCKLRKTILDDSPNKRPQPLEVSSFPFLEEQLEKTFNEGHSKILEQNLKNLLHTSSSTFKEKKKIWLGDLNDRRIFDPSLLPKIHFCAMCLVQEATKVCSNCRKEWYCSRKCQKEDWKDHKKGCRTKTVTANTLRMRLVLT
jgi:hypothetical protein